MTFPTSIDSTMVSDFRECPLSFYYRYIRGLVPKGGSGIHIIAGAAMAVGLETARKAYHVYGLPPDEAVCAGAEALLTTHQDPANPKKPVDRLLEAFISYFERWPLDGDYLQPLVAEGSPCIEFNFAVPLPYTHPETGDPLLYSGRCDMIADYRGAICIVDDKTTSQLGPTWPQQWKLRGQLTGYAWAARVYGFEVSTSVVRGVCLLKEGARLAEAIVGQPNWKINRWLEQLYTTVEDMLRQYKDGYWRMSLGTACSAFGGCPYSTLCDTPYPEDWLDQYSIEFWSPLHVDQEKLESIIRRRKV